MRPLGAGRSLHVSKVSLIGRLLRRLLLLKRSLVEAVVLPGPLVLLAIDPIIPVPIVTAHGLISVGLVPFCMQNQVKRSMNQCYYDDDALLMRLQFAMALPRFYLSYIATFLNHFSTNPKIHFQKTIVQLS